MTKLCQCKNCPCKFRNIKNLSLHRNKEHPNSVSASIRNGIRKSPNTPQNKNKRLIKVVQDIAGVAAAITPAIVTRNPTLALAAADDIARLLTSVKELIE